MDWLSSFRHVWLLDFESSSQMVSDQYQYEWSPEISSLANSSDFGSTNCHRRRSRSATIRSSLPTTAPPNGAATSLWGGRSHGEFWTCTRSFSCLTSGLHRPCGRGSLGALSYFGLDGIEAAEKDAMRELVLWGGPWSEAERAES